MTLTMLLRARLIKQYIKIFFLFSYLNSVLCTVFTDSGPIFGKISKYDGYYYKSFEGIRYAQAPVGELRYKPPVEVTCWNKLYNATQPGPKCPQSNIPSNQTSEDCLYLNIYVPLNVTSNGPISVFFWIHGGEFKSTSGNRDYGPQYLMKYDVILVAAYYRLGALGFLSLYNEDIPGNAGIKDLILALRWININIAQFNGDPKSITIGGNSAGAVLTHYLLLTEKIENLFQRAILQSGSALGYRFYDADTYDHSLALAQFLCQEESYSNIYDCLKNADISDIIKGQEAIGDLDTRKGFRPFTPFVPTLEHTSSSLFEKSPKDVIRNGIPQNVPVLVGFNCLEGLKMTQTVLTNKTLLDLLNEDFHRCLPTDLLETKNEQQQNRIIDKVREYYFNGTKIQSGLQKGFIDLTTDTQFSYATNRWLKFFKQNPKSADVYSYNFCFKGDLNLFNRFTSWGSAHGDELGYLFYVSDVETMTIDRRTKHMQDIMLTMWTSFIKTGNPMLMNERTTLWKPAIYPTMNHLSISDNIVEIQNISLQNRTTFWDNIYLNSKV